MAKNRKLAERLRGDPNDPDATIIVDGIISVPYKRPDPEPLVKYCQTKAEELARAGDPRASRWAERAASFEREGKQGLATRYLGLSITGGVVTRENRPGQQVNLDKHATGRPLFALLLTAGERGMPREELREKLGKTDRALDRAKQSLNAAIQKTLRVTLRAKGGVWLLKTWGRQTA